MDVFSSRYYNIPTFLLKIAGLWPEHSKFRKNVSFIIFTITVFSLVIPVFFGMTRAFKNNETIKMIEDAIGCLFFLAVYSKYVAYYIFEKRMRLVYDQVTSNWNNITNDIELSILRKYSQEGRILILIYASYGVFAAIAFCSIPYIPLVLDFAFPLNESRELLFPYYPNYFFIDEIKYHYTMFTFHGGLIIVTCIATGAGTDCMYVANVKHNCGLFAIVCHRLGRIGFCDNKVSINDNEVYKEMKSIFGYHRDSIKSSLMIEYALNGTFLIVNGAAVVGVALLVFDLLLNLGNTVQMIRVGVLAFGIYLSIFYINYIAQQLENSSEEVYNYVTSGYWYNASPRTQKLMIMISMRSQKPCVLSCGGLFYMNVQTFYKIVKTSISYVTIMLQMQQK